MKKITTLIIFVIFLALLLPVMASAEVTGYVHGVWSQEKGFFVPLTVFTLRGAQGSWSYMLEINPAAYYYNKDRIARDIWLQYSPNKWLSIRAGKMFMFFTDSPNPKGWWLPDYPLCHKKISTIFDAGVVAMLKTSQGDRVAEFTAGVLNGNELFSDNNEEKDLYLHANLQLGGAKVGQAYQSGQQPDGYRTRTNTHFRVDLPVNVKILAEYFFEQSKLGEVVKRKWGWYAIGIWSVRKLQFVLLYDNYTETDLPFTENLTFGFNFLPSPDIILRTSYTLEFPGKAEKFVLGFQYNF
jgi:hypothetical protein